MKNWIEKNRVLTFIIFWGMFFLVAFVPSYLRNRKSDVVGVYVDNGCIMRQMTLDSLSELAAREGMKVTAEDVAWINERPLCEDLCKQQLEYASEYSDWFAENDLRNTCAEFGILLPPNK